MRALLLSIQQKYILEALRKLDFIRKRQLAVLVRRKFQRPGLEISDAGLNAMLHQLRVGCGSFRIDGEIIGLSGAQPDDLHLEAIDVMLELAEGVPEDFTVRVEWPELLRFSWGGNHPRLFTVAGLSTPSPPAVEALAQKKRVVWIASGGDACQTGSVLEGLAFPPKHFFAARLPDGSHRFYGSQEP